MQCCYVTYLTELEDSVECYSPDANIVTAGRNAVEAVSRMRARLEQWIENILSNGGNPNDSRRVRSREAKGVIAIIDVEIADGTDEESRYVRKNVTLSAWLNREAEKRGISFSKELQDALIDELGLHDAESGE